MFMYVNTDVTLSYNTDTQTPDVKPASVDTTNSLYYV
jgi:hypothetical protein